MSLMSKARAQLGANGATAPMVAANVVPIVPSPAAAVAAAPPKASQIEDHIPAQKAEVNKTYQLPNGAMGSFIGFLAQLGKYGFLDPTSGLVTQLDANDPVILPSAKTEAPKQPWAAPAANVQKQDTPPVEVTKFEPPSSEKKTEEPPAPTATPPDSPAAKEKAPRAPRRLKPPSTPTLDAKDAPAPAQAAPEASPETSLALFVNCIPNYPVQSLDPYIREVVADLEAAQGLVDLRAPTTADHPAAFGRWKGFLAAAVRAEPPKGAFVVWTRGSEFAEVVVEALAPICAPGSLVRAM